MADSWRWQLPGSRISTIACFSCQRDGGSIWPPTRPMIFLLIPGALGLCGKPGVPTVLQAKRKALNELRHAPIADCALTSERPPPPPGLRRQVNDCVAVAILNSLDCNAVANKYARMYRERQAMVWAG